MSEETTTTQPVKRKGAHKPDCACGWCKTRAANIAKKNATPSAVKPPEKSANTSAEKSPSTNGDGASSKPSSSPNSTPPKKTANASGEMQAKIAAMTKEKTTAAQPQKKNESAAETAQPKKGWFEQLAEAPNTFFD